MQSTPAPEPEPKRSRRMIVWLVAVPAVVLFLLVLACANWKSFHLAYAKHLIASSDIEEQERGVEMVINTHLREGMTLEEVRAILAPGRVTETDWSPDVPLQLRAFTVRLPNVTLYNALGFDKNNRLRYIDFDFFPGIQRPRK